jgi:predicted ribosomally synthesized peptide with SipW-like signal peptide
MMKKRIALVALSAVLVFSLVIGGTLMLFTAQSETATNVVTLGDIKVALQEHDGSGDYQTIGAAVETDNQLPNGWYDNGVFKGLQFKNAIPGNSYTKNVRVTNTGDNPFYAAVYGRITFKNTEGNKLDWEVITQLIDETLENAEIGFSSTDVTVDYNEDGVLGDPEDFQTEKNYLFLGLILNDNKSVSDEWFGAPIMAKDGEFFGSWYYVGNDPNTLEIVPAKTGATPSVFDGDIYIPEALGNFAQGITISLDMYAAAVQSDNIESSEITGGPYQWMTVFGNGDPEW